MEQPVGCIFKFVLSFKIHLFTSMHNKYYHVICWFTSRRRLNSDLIKT